MHKHVKFTHVCIKMLNLQQSDILVDFPIGCLQCSLCLNQCSLHFSLIYIQQRYKTKVYTYTFTVIRVAQCTFVHNAHPFLAWKICRKNVISWFEKRVKHIVLVYYMHPSYKIKNLCKIQCIIHRSLWYICSINNILIICF